MRRFVDLHLAPESAEQTWKMLSLASRMGYKTIASTNLIEPVNLNLTIASRIDIEANKPKELMDKLRKVRQRYDLVAVKCLKKEVARQAAKDSRVDVILFSEDPLMRKQNGFDTHVAELAKTGCCAYELNAINLIYSSTIHLSKLIVQLKKELGYAIRHNVPVIISSGANYPLTMREPRALSSIASLLDIEEENALDMISNIPNSILNHRKNRGVDH